MEGFNGEIRDREKVMWSLKRTDTPILGYKIFHNYVRPHMALDGKTPSEVAGKLEGENKWLALIENAAKYGKSKARNDANLAKELFSNTF